MGAPKSGQCRIIGGQWRGRKIHFPDLDTLRPTPDRVRETLFNWLQRDIVGAVCLDAYAGSGALGFEALSRGAKQVMMFEQDRVAYQSLRDNATRLQAEALQVVWQRFPPSPSVPLPLFDIIFLDPPFQSTGLQESLAYLDRQNCLAPNGLLYLEQSRRQPVLETAIGWQPLRMMEAGQVRAALYQRL